MFSLKTLVCFRSDARPDNRRQAARAGRGRPRPVSTNNRASASPKLSPKDGLILGQRRRRWANIKPALSQCTVTARVSLLESQSMRASFARHRDDPTPGYLRMRCGGAASRGCGGISRDSLRAPGSSAVGRVSAGGFLKVITRAADDKAPERAAVSPSTGNTRVCWSLPQSAGRPLINQTDTHAAATLLQGAVNKIY